MSPDTLPLTDCSDVRAGGQYNCEKCGRTHPAGPCEIFNHEPQTEEERECLAAYLLKLRQNAEVSHPTKED